MTAPRLTPFQEALIRKHVDDLAVHNELYGCEVKWEYNPRQLHPTGERAAEWVAWVKELYAERAKQTPGRANKHPLVYYQMVYAFLQAHTADLNDTGLFIVVDGATFFRYTTKEKVICKWTEMADITDCREVFSCQYDCGSADGALAQYLLYATMDDIADWEDSIVNKVSPE